MISSDNYKYGGAGAKSVSSGTAAPFMEVSGNTIKCHGRIIEADHHELFYSKFHKIVNSLFRGEPFQFGHQTLEYLVRVEEVGSTYSTQCTDFFLYGNYMGRLVPGDEVEIIAKNKGGRRVVKKLFNVSTNSTVRPDIQLPAGLIQTLALVLLFLIIMLIAGAVASYHSGEASNALASLALLLGGGAVIRGWFKSKFGR